MEGRRGCKGEGGRGIYGEFYCYIGTAYDSHNVHKLYRHGYPNGYMHLYNNMKSTKVQPSAQFDCNESALTYTPSFPYVNVKRLV